MTTIKAVPGLEKSLNKVFGQYTFQAGIKNDSNRRKEVLHNKRSLMKVSRGYSNKKSYIKSQTTNLDILEDILIKYRFNFYLLSFSKANPNYKTFITSIKYIFNDKGARLENAITANLRAFLDMQRVRSNTPETVKIKQFNRFGIDSRQFQLALGCKRVLTEIPNPKKN